MLITGDYVRQKDTKGIKKKYIYIYIERERKREDGREEKD